MNPVESAAGADRIASFYERHPYPPPVDDLEAYRRSWTDERRREETLRLWPDGSVGEARTILSHGSQLRQVQAPNIKARQGGAQGGRAANQWVLPHRCQWNLCQKVNDL